MLQIISDFHLEAVLDILAVLHRNTRAAWLRSSVTRGSVTWLKWFRIIWNGNILIIIKIWIINCPPLLCSDISINQLIVSVQENLLNP